MNSALLTLPLLLGVCTAFILEDAVLPQYHKYGKSLVLVGGALAENNSEVYNAIIEMSVSSNLLSRAVNTLHIYYILKNLIPYQR